MSKAINDTDRYTVTTSAIQDLVGKVKAEDAKKVDIKNVSLEAQVTTILAQVQAMAASNIHYRRFYTTSDGGSANISDKPTGTTNAGFVCEAYCNRRVSASDWRYVVLCYVKETRPYIAWVTNSTTAISWNTLDTHWTSHLYAGSGAAANAATTNGNTKLTVADNSTVRNTVTVQGSNNVSVSSDANGVITIDGSHNHDAVYMKATAGTKNLASNTETTIGTVNGSDVKLKMPVIPGASSTTPIVDGTASKGSESSWARGDHVHPTDTSREAASNKKTTLNSTSDTDFPTSKAVATFVNSSIATATANFLGTYDVVADLGLTTSATNAQIATALGSHTWPSGVTPTNNDYVFVSVDDPGTTTASAEYSRFKYDGSAWSYEYTLNNSSFTQAQWDAINSGVTASFVTNAVTGVKGSSESSYRTGQVNITKSNIGLGSVVNTGDSATPVSGGTTKFTTGGAYTELGKKVSISGDTMTGVLKNTTIGKAIQVSHGTANQDAFISAERTDMSLQVSFGVGAGGVNHGVFSNKNNNWIIKADTSGNVTINHGKASNKVAIGNSNLGSTTKPIYLAAGVPTEGSAYAGGTAVTLNGTSAAASTASFYAPTGAGTSNYVLKSNGSGAPTWVEKAPKASAADTATHRAEQGYTRLWSNGRYDSTKPYALLAQKTVSTTVNWGFGQLFKLEVQGRYIIFKINLAGTQSAVSTGTTVYILHGINWTTTELNKALIVTYDYTANATCTVRIYSDLSLAASHWQRVSLRQLDNHAGDQLAYNDWDVFTFYKNNDNSNMVASVTGTVMTHAFDAGKFYGNATSAAKATNDSDGNAINATYFKSSGNVTLVSGTATKIGTQNGTDVKLTLPTIPAAANNGALQLQLNGGTATSKFTANQSGNSTLAFSTGSTAGTFKVDSTEIAIAGFTKVEASSTNGNIKINGTETTVYTHPTTSGNKHVPSGGSSGQFLGWSADGTAAWVNNPNTDTKVKATAKTDNVEYKILATASASPTSGNATEAVYDVDITLNPSTNTIAASISGNAATATKPAVTVLTESDDLNDAMGSAQGDVVWYRWKSGHEPVNYPTIGTAEMEVVRMHDGNYCTQTVYVANNDTVYRRVNKNGTWGSWYAYSKSNHAHGNITNGGALQTTDIDIASGDKLVVTDATNSNRVARTSISFDGSTETTALTPKGTWVSFVRSDAEVSYSGGSGIDVTGSGTARTISLNVSSIPEATIKSLIAGLS